MNCNKILSELYSHEYKGWQLGLGRVTKLLSAIGNPQKKLKCIHVAGTNGKGSVCAFLDSILRKAGYKVGLYTSPHLIRFNERIKINGKDISDKDIVKHYLKVKKEAESFFFHATFFEITTAIAFSYFAENNVDFAVLEVGLGGRLDATNMITPLISIITNVSMEHEDYLGDTIEKIAYEKAGIIKNGIPVLTAANGKALEVIKKTAKEKNSPVYYPERISKSVSGIRIGDYENLKLGLRGDFQLENAAIAVTAIDILKNSYAIDIPDSSIKAGLEDAKWPARFEFLSKNTLIDCAHNPDGMKTLAKEIKKLKCSNLTLVIGILKDKDYKKMLKIIVPLARKVILTKPNNPRAAEPEELAVCFKHLKKQVIITKSLKEALTEANLLTTNDQRQTTNDLVLITGSIYLVGEAIMLIKRRN